MSTGVSPTPITPQGLEQVERANATTAPISERENPEIEAANASGNTPVVFIHGSGCCPRAGTKWVEFFEENGYARLAWRARDRRGGPGKPRRARQEEAKQVADHTAEVIGALDKKPAVMGHSTGGTAGPAGRRPRAFRRDGLAVAFVAHDQDEQSSPEQT
jgi:pimeloyl-ACP methyl ester carboxylesterase